MARILAIDDEDLVLHMLQRALVGHELVTARDGVEAIEILAQTYRPFELVLCDMVMPRMGGSAVWRAVAERWPHLLPRFVIVTGGVLDDHDRGFLHEHALRVVAKPFTLDQLRGVVRDTVGADPTTPARTPGVAARG